MKTSFFRPLSAWMLAAGSAFVLAGCREPAAEAPPPPAPEVAVHAVTASPVSLTAELPGRTSAYLVSEVRPQVTGILQARLFEEGSDVQAGDVL